MLTMNVSAFGSMSVEEWELFEKGQAVERCQSQAFDFASLGFNTTQECVEHISHLSEVWCALNNKPWPWVQHKTPLVVLLQVHLNQLARIHVAALYGALFILAIHCRVRARGRSHPP